MNIITEAEEKKHLAETIHLIAKALEKTEKNISNFSDDINANNQYIWDNIYDMDPEEIAAMRQDLKTSMSVGENKVMIKHKQEKLLSNPYFGRIDFRNYSTNQLEPIYIGLYNFSDEGTGKTLIYDWRAPISGMYYDFELGKAHYECPMGVIDGEITLKRQYHIKDGKLDFMIESSVAIDDSILQHELNSTSDEKMKGIVATIQREQNKIIRNDKTKTLIIQGVAGSGKSSIALHRAAYLLYRMKGEINSKNIMIISPNKVFADYISTVLPELGEDNILEISFEDIAAKELKKICKYQTFFEQVEELSTSCDEQLIKRISFKSSVGIIEQLRTFVNKKKSTIFKPKSIKTSTYTISAIEIMQEYCKYTRLSEKDKEEELVKFVFGRIERGFRVRLLTDDKKRIKEEVREMFQKPDILSLYNEFYVYIGKPELFQKRNDKLEYSDVFPLILLKMLYEGVKEISSIKHLIIDEMQDYTPVQYYLVSLLFKCNKTILGDAYQSVNPYSSSSVETISKVFTDAECMNLFQSYRSTFEINTFAQKILFNKNLIPFERHGSQVIVNKCLNHKEQIQWILNEIHSYTTAKFKTIGIICKTNKKALELYKRLSETNKNIYLLDSDGDSFIVGTILTSTHMSKGLEFDCVIVPDVDDSNYSSEMDRSLLYIACTRAMHKLVLSYVGTKTPFIKR